jgi:hypothetical protein
MRVAMPGCVDLDALHEITVTWPGRSSDTMKRSSQWPVVPASILVVTTSAAVTNLARDDRFQVAPVTV